MCRQNAPRRHVEHDFTAPVAQLAQLAEHEDLGAVLGAKVERLDDGETERNGVGRADLYARLAASG